MKAGMVPTKQFHTFRGVEFMPSLENKKISNTYYLNEESINLQFINFKIGNNIHEHSIHRKKYQI